jgi:zinc and cadmium transporter
MCLIGLQRVYQRVVCRNLKKHEMIIWFNALFSVFVVSLISLAGIVFISMKPVRLQGIIFILVSFAIGGLFGDCFFHLLPAAYVKIRNPSKISFFIILGILAFFILEKFLLWRHDHHIQDDKNNKIKPLGYISLVADSVHNLFDGVLIGSSYLVSFKIGLATTVAVIMHEIPHEIGNFGVLVHSGFTIKRALLLNFMTACTAIFGTVCALIFGEMSGEFTNLILPFAGGGFIYLAGSDLVPELKKSNSLVSSLVQFLIIICGLSLLYLFTFLEN